MSVEPTASEKVEPPTPEASVGSDAEDGAAPQERGHPPRVHAFFSRIGDLVRAISDGDDAQVEQAVLQLSQSRRIFAPLGLVVGGFAMLFEGVRLLFKNWRLTLVQLLPAMWIWAAMLDLKVHVIHQKSFHTIRGRYLIPAVAVIAVITAASFFLNAVFAFAISSPGTPKIRPAFRQARSHLAMGIVPGLVIGTALGMSTVVFDRWGRWWFGVSMSIVIAVMMVAYVSIPSRLIGMKTTYSRTDKLKAAAVGGAIGAVVCSPPYAIGRIGILMLGSHVLFIPGVILLTFGITLQAGATSAVKAIKMSAKLVAGQKLDTPEPQPAGPASPAESAA